jgi:hypothetical protein
MTSLWKCCVSENGKIIYTNAIGKDDINNKKATISTNIELVLYLKCFTSVLILKPSKKEIKSESNY